MLPHAGAGCARALLLASLLAFVTASARNAWPTHVSGQHEAGRRLLQVPPPPITPSQFLSSKCFSTLPPHFALPGKLTRTQALSPTQPTLRERRSITASALTAPAPRHAPVRALAKALTPCAAGQQHAGVRGS